MDLGISGRKAIVSGASAGLGLAIAKQLAEAGVNLVLVARQLEKLEVARSEIVAAQDVSVDICAVDVGSVEQRARFSEVHPHADILINNAGGPPVGDFRKLSRQDWFSALETNMLGAIDLINVYLDGMCEQQFGRVVNITSHMVKSPSAMLSLSNGARAGLSGYVGGIARDVARHNVTLNNLMPGQFDTDRLKSNLSKFASKAELSIEETQAKFVRDIPARRFGRPQEFGSYAAFLCSAQAGFVTGQNLLIDGGQYPGLF